MSNRPAAAVLAEAAAAAGFAPSVHNTQPWRWRVSDEGLDLFADRSRQLQIADPAGRLLTISCGAALHHARVSLAAQGWTAKIELLPDSSQPDHLARLNLEAHHGVTPGAMRLLQTIRVRRTDRRPVSEIPVASTALAAVRQAILDESMDVHMLTPEQVVDLGAACAQADLVEIMDSQQRLELAYWVGGDRTQGTGVPDFALLMHSPHTIVPGRDFVRTGTLEPGPGHDRAATYAVLLGPGDEPLDWLRAGQALSAGWLVATELGLSVLPFSAVIEVIATREALRRLLANVAWPYLVVRLGAPDPAGPGMAHTPRLPTEQIIDVG